MSIPLLLIMAAIDVYVAIEYIKLERWGMFMTWMAYAVSCIGFAFDLKVKG